MSSPTGRRRLDVNRRLERLAEEYEREPADHAERLSEFAPFRRDVERVRTQLENKFHGLDDLFYALRVSPLSEEGYWIAVMWEALRLTKKE